MNYRKLGRFGIKVSEVALGGWLTHGRTLEDSQTQSIVHRAFDLGINFFDTADVYNLGAAEESLAKAISSMRRQDLVVATKCFFPMSDRPNDRGLSRKHIVESVDASLRRLKTDYIDLYQFHRFDETTPLDETVRAIDDVIRQGKVLYWGVSQWKAHEISQVSALAEKLNAHPPASNQPIYNVLTRGIEGSVIPVCEQLGIGQVVFSPLAQGVLTGKYKPGQPAKEGTRAADPKSNQFMLDMMNDEVLTKVVQAGEWAKGKGLTLTQASLAWCLRQPILSSVIVGATSIEQIEGSVASSGIQLSPEEWAEFEAFF